MNCAFSYEFKLPGVHKVKAEVAGRVCQELSESEGGLTPQRLVDVSRDNDAPLHNEFEWDDDLAAELYRRGQAAKLIRDIVIVREDGDPHKDRQFVITNQRESAYVQLDVALSNEDWKANLLKQAKNDMISFIAKYRRLQELTQVIEPMKDLIDLLNESV